MTDPMRPSDQTTPRRPALTRPAIPPTSRSGTRCRPSTPWSQRAPRCTARHPRPGPTGRASPRPLRPSFRPPSAGTSRRAPVAPTAPVVSGPPRRSRDRLRVPGRRPVGHPCLGRDRHRAERDGRPRSRRDVPDLDERPERRQQPAGHDRRELGDDRRGRPGQPGGRAHLDLGERRVVRRGDPRKWRRLRGHLRQRRLDPDQSPRRRRHRVDAGRAQRWPDPVR